MPAIHEILLDVIGDSDSAREELVKTAAEIKAFGKISAEAEARVNVEAATAKLDEMRAQLERIDLTRATPEVKVDVESALARISTLRGELAVLDHTSVDVGVGADQKWARRAGTIGRDVERVGQKLRQLDGDASGLSGWFDTLGVHVGQFTGKLGDVIPLVLALSPLIAALVAAVTALASSLASAVLGLGALAIAFGASLLPAILVVVGALKDFKKESGTAGTAAAALKNSFEEVGKELDWRKIIDPVFRGLQRGFAHMHGLLKALQAPLQGLGKVIGTTFGHLLTRLSSPAWQKFFGFLVRSSQQVVPLIGKGFGHLLTLLRNIATAAMPFMVAGLKHVVGWLGNVARKTSDIKSLRNIIATMVRDLKAWLGLLSAVAGAFTDVAKIADPFGRQLVHWLTRGVQSMRDFLQSSKGKEEVRQFFKETLPLAKSLVSFVAKLALAFLQLGQFLAPVFKPVVDGLNFILDVLNFLLNKLNDIPAPIRAIIGFLAGMMSGFSEVEGITFAVIKLGSSLGAIVTIVQGLGGKIGAAFKSVLGAVTGFFGSFKGAGEKAAHALISGFNFLNSLPGKVAGFIRDAFKRIVSFYATFYGGALHIGVQVVKGVVNGIKNIAGRVGDFVRAAFRRIVNFYATFYGGALHLGIQVVKGIVNGIAGIAGKVGDLLRAAWHTVQGWASNFYDAAKHIGSQVVNGIGDGIRAIWDTLSSVASSLAHKIIDAVKSTLGIGSPSKVFEQIGHWVVEGFIKGLSAANIGTLIAKQFGGMAKLAAELVKKGLIDIPKKLIGKAWDIFGAPLNLGISGFSDVLGLPPEEVAPHLVGHVPKSEIEAILGPKHHHHHHHHRGLAAGIRRAAEGIYRVGEMGPELAYIPSGGDVFSAGDTRRIMRSLARGETRGETTQHITVVSPAGTIADPEVAAGKLALRLRQEGRR